MQIPGKNLAIDKPKILRLDGVTKAINRACTAAQKEFWNRYNELLDMSNLDALTVKSVLANLDEKHQEENGAVHTSPSHGKRERSRVSFSRNRDGQTVDM